MASLEQVLDLNTTNFEDIIGRLKAYEERICDDEDGEEDQAKLMYTSNDGQSSQTISQTVLLKIIQIIIMEIHIEEEVEADALITEAEDEAGTMGEEDITEDIMKHTMEEEISREMHQKSPAFDAIRLVTSEPNVQIVFSNCRRLK